MGSDLAIKRFSMASDIPMIYMQYCILNTKVTFFFFLLRHRRHRRLRVGVRSEGRKGREHKLLCANHATRQKVNKQLSQQVHTDAQGSGV